MKHCEFNWNDRPRDEQLLKVTKLLQELTIKNMPIEYLKLINTSVDDATIEYICQIKNMRKCALINYYFYFHLPNRDVIESYINRIESDHPNLEFLQFQTHGFIDIVFTDEHINLIEKKL